ncbi:hypothetical protein OESDEN_13311 [Oesophagostomum dentatum]|uniref:Retrotransposon gag domain-containing protein n=1 Tax=Oesophagostomum dentatum TaxID=61180 RepID=A0A0B1SUN0_OESDE|nr:hypothetical protein OESDEN_13311 [Oesophagostomum dentatum]
MVLTRSQSNEFKVDHQPPASVTPQPMRALSATLSELGDTDPVHGKDAKALRDATAYAITEVWKDSKASTALLAHQVNKTNSSLVHSLNESFSSVGSKIDSLPRVATFGPDGQFPQIPIFSGSGEGPMQFSIWLRRLEDVLRMRSPPLSPELKANFLIGYLDDVAREKIEELSDDDRKSFESVVAHLKKFFEGPQQRYLARQSLSSCRQEPGESTALFANRLLNLVQQRPLDKILVFKKTAL